MTNDAAPNSSVELQNECDKGSEGVKEKPSLPKCDDGTFVLGDGLEVRSLSFGKGVFATKKFVKGDLMFDETPIGSAQHFYSKKLVTACEGCCKTLGSLRTRIGKVLQANLEGAKFLETDFPEIALDPLLDDPLFSREGMKYKAMVPCNCEKEDCRVVFCSEECMEERGEAHRELSKGDWHAFHQYAAKKHENLRLGLQLLVSPKRELLKGLYNPRWSYLTNLPPEWNAYREKIVAESYELLRTGWVYDHPLVSLEEWDRTLGIVDFTSKCLKSVNQGNIQLVRARRSTKFSAFYWDNAMFWGLLTKIGHEAQMHHLNTEEPTHPEQHKEELDEVEIATAFKKSGNILPDLEGVGVYQNIAYLNHSCYPNIEVTCKQDDRVLGKCVRDIDVGDEVFMSYLDEDEPLSERQKSLWEDYVFKCRCIKCRVQGASYILNKVMEGEESMKHIVDYLKEYAEENQISLEFACEGIIRSSPEIWASCLGIEEEEESEEESGEESGEEPTIEEREERAE